MIIQKNVQGNTLTIALEGRLDTTSAPQLEEEINSSLGDSKELVMDYKDLAYLSSAGLRVILSAQKKMNSKGGKMIIRNVNETIMEVFEVTGFADILTIE